MGFGVVFYLKLNMTQHIKPLAPFKVQGRDDVMLCPGPALCSNPSGVT